MELRKLATEKREEKARKAAEKAAQPQIVVEKKMTTDGTVTVEDVTEEDSEDDANEMTENTPEARVKVRVSEY